MDDETNSPDVAELPERDEAEWQRLLVHSLTGRAHEIMVREDDRVREVRKQLVGQTWSHVDLTSGHRKLKDEELVHSLVRDGLQINMVVVQSQLVMACVGKDLWLWGCQCGSLLTIKTFASAPTALLADVPSKRVLVGCSNGQLELLNVDEKSSTVFQRGHGFGWVQCVQAFWENDLAVVAYANNDSQLAIYKLSDPTCLWTIPLPTRVMQIAVGRSGGEKVCISSCLDLGPVICYLEGFQFRQVRAPESIGSGLALDVDWDGQRIVTGTTSGVLELCSFSTGKIELQFRTQRSHERIDIRDIAANWATERAVTASSDGKLRLWNLQDGTLVSMIKGHTDRVCSLSADFEQGLMCSSGSHDGLKLWRIKEEFELVSEMPESLQSAKEKCCVFSMIPAAACQLLNSLGPH